MAKTIVILGTLDTKGQFLYILKRHIEARGHRTIILDLSMGSTPAFSADISTAEVARAAGRRIEERISTGDRSVCTKVMIEGAQQKVLELVNLPQPW